MDETDLVSRSQRGDLASFNQLVEVYQAQVYNLALRMLSGIAEAQDVTQETFIAAFHAIKSFRGGDLRVWLLRIAANRCRDELRKRRRRPTASLDAILLDPQAPAFGSPEPGPENHVLRDELAQCINRGLASIPENQRLAVVLSDVQGLSYEEIAGVMNTSLGTVKSRISRGRAHLRSYLMAQGELLPGQYRHD